jgi:hypothetical protein
VGRIEQIPIRSVFKIESRFERSKSSIAMKVQNNGLVEDLRREEERFAEEAELLREAEELLQRGEKEDERVLERIRNARSNEGSPIDPEELEDERVFSEEAIRELCVKYRLRFLSTRYFKDELPYDAVSELKRFEKKTGRRVEDLRIVAPSERFELQDSHKDPLLFAYLGKGRHYLLHRWGNDLSPLRKWLNFPARDIKALILTCALLSLLISTVIPASSFGLGEDAPSSLIVLSKGISFFMLSSFFTTAALIYGVTTSKEFSADQWDSKFFN